MVLIQASSNFMSGNTVFMSRILWYPSPSKNEACPVPACTLQWKKKKYVKIELSDRQYSNFF